KIKKIWFRQLEFEEYFSMDIGETLKWEERRSNTNFYLNMYKTKLYDEVLKKRLPIEILEIHK
ncbi:hypothetical protein KCQ63_29520, partial [Klebsiella pneumoniae]|nr:hypothetical protein [Klebsiella pneumoniae]